jgi:hypothetical protein
MAQRGLQRPVPGVLRVSSLIAPPALLHYQLKRWNDIVVDVDEFIQSGFGTAWHQYLSGFTGDNTQWFVEQQLQMEADGYLISGTPDLRSTTGGIDDYKVTSAWSFVFTKPAWTQQLNMYALLAEANQFPVNRLRIYAFLRDWSVRNAQRYKPDYPSRPFHTVSIPLWSLEDRKSFLEQRLEDHKSGVRPCTATERWAQPTTWAVKSQGVTRARKVCDTEEQAKKWIAAQKNNTKLSIERRLGACRRCEEYCFVRSVCEYRESYDGSSNQAL